MPINTYSSFKYGQSKYGATAAEDRLLWGVTVDWQGDGRPESLARLVIDMQIKRGRDYFIRLSGDNTATGFQPVRPGTLNITLDDPERIYDPNNTSSPLYPYIEPGAPIRVLVRVTPGIDHKYLFTGTISDIQSYNNGDAHFVSISAVDDLQDLSDINILSDVKTNIAISAAVSEVLDLAGWTGGRSIQTSGTTIPYWWENRRAYTAINELEETEGGYFFVDTQGNAVYYSQFYEPAISTIILEAEMLKNINFSRPWEAVRNFIRAVANPVSVGSLSDVWKLGQIPLIAIGGSLILWATFNKAAIDTVTPAATTDYLANSAADGSGANLTGSVTVSMVSAGQSARLQIQNSSSTAAYITLLKIRGKALGQDDALSSEISINSGQRLFASDTRWRQTIAQAKQYAAWLSLFISEKKAHPTIRLENVIDKQFDIELFDRVTATIPARDIDDDYIVGGIEHRWKKSNGQAVETTLKLEPTRIVSDSLLAMSADQRVDNVASHINFDIIPEINDLPQRSVSIWIYPVDRTSSVLRYFASWSMRYSIGYDTALKHIGIVSIYSGGLAFWHTPNDSISLDQWQNVTITHDRSVNPLAAPVIYIDGVSQVVTTATAPSGTLFAETDSLFTIGNFYLNLVYNRAFPGLYRDARVYNRILTAGEAEDLFDGTAVSSTGLLLQALYIAKNRLAEYEGQPLGTKQVFDNASFYIGTTTETNAPVIRAFDYEP